MEDTTSTYVVFGEDFDEHVYNVILYGKIHGKFYNDVYLGSLIYKFDARAWAVDGPLKASDWILTTRSGDVIDCQTGNIDRALLNLDNTIKRYSPKKIDMLLKW